MKIIFVVSISFIYVVSFSSLELSNYLSHKDNVLINLCDSFLTFIKITTYKVFHLAKNINFFNIWNNSPYNNKNNINFKVLEVS